MRTHGWARNPPVTDEEARERIIAATIRCIDRFGPEKTSLSDVATEVGVTRKTIYRYFASTEALLWETGLVAAEEYLARLIDHVDHIDDPADLLVEAAAFSIEQLPRERHTGVLLATGHSNTFARGVLSPEARKYGSEVLDRLHVDWDAELAPGVRREQLVELVLRLIQSFVLNPGDPPLVGEPLRDLLRISIAPALGGKLAR